MTIENLQVIETDSIGNIINTIVAATFNGNLSTSNNGVRIDASGTYPFDSISAIRQANLKGTKIVSGQEYLVNPDDFANRDIIKIKPGPFEIVVNSETLRRVDIVGRKNNLPSITTEIVLRGISKGSPKRK